VRIAETGEGTGVLDSRFKAGFVQFDVRKGQVEANLETALRYLAELASCDVRLAVLPEMFSCSFDNENLNEHSKHTDDILNELSCFAAGSGMAVCGSLPRKKDGRIYNTQVFVDIDGKIKAKYHKIHLFRPTDEHIYYTCGNEMVIAGSGLGRAGMMICYDLRFPELARSLCLGGAKIIMVSAQWPKQRKDHWEILLRARAVENQVFVIGANRTGKEQGLTFPGMSMVVDPMGNIIAGPGSSQMTGWAMIDPALTDQCRALIPCMEDRKQDVYGQDCKLC
jgi:predicted amidohydrolase